MSEPDSGSDLAALRTKAEKKGDIYLVNGTKLWTSGAHRCQYMIALFKTSQEEDRHGGFQSIYCGSIFTWGNNQTNY
jgi:acyl-CoA dehydrogenase